MVLLYQRLIDGLAAAGDGHTARPRLRSSDAHRPRARAPRHRPRASRRPQSLWSRCPDTLRSRVLERGFSRDTEAEISVGNRPNSWHALGKSPLRRRVERVQSRDHSQSTGFRFLSLTRSGFESPRSHYVLSVTWKVAKAFPESREGPFRKARKPLQKTRKPFLDGLPTGFDCAALGPLVLMGERSGIGCPVQRRLPMADLERTVIAASRHVDMQATRRCAVAPLGSAMIACSRATTRLLRAPRTAKDLGTMKL